MCLHELLGSGHPERLNEAKGVRRWTGTYSPAVEEGEQAREDPADDDEGVVVGIEGDIAKLTR